VTRGTVRREVRIACPPDKVWELVGDLTRLPEWWPGITDAVVEGRSRVITTGSGMPMPEEIVTHDDLLRRYQYRITGGVLKEHLSTLDVHDLGDGTCLVVYSVDADPDAMALIIGGAAGNALEHLRTLMEG
jgi:hypothetical protein